MLILPLALLLWGVPLNAETNLLPNPSFEMQTAGGVSGWTSRSWSGGSQARWQVDSPGRTGQHCLSIRSKTGSDAAWTATVTVQPNSLYRLSGWIKTNARIRDAPQF